MNRIKRICTLLTAVGLAVVMALGVMPDLSVAGAFRKNAEKVTAPAVKAEAAEVVVTDPRDYIYFDLAAGNVTISASTYSGAIYKSGTVQPVSGTHSPENKYYIYQSTAANQANTGYVTPADETNRNCTVPDYPRVMQGTRSWSEYITNNIDVYKVSGDWKTAAENAQRKSTGNRIIFAQDSNYTADVTIDNIWSHYVEATTSRTTGGIGAHLTQREKTHVRLRLKGDNRVGCVHYSADKESGNTIEFYNGDSEKEPGSITAADFSDNWRANHWNAVIGAADNPGDSADMSEGIEIHGGVIYAGATWEDNCTAIGGGGNQYGGVTIKGGRVTAVTAGTGTAIGGGIGYSDQGGDTDVDISGGEIYAYNLGIDYEKTGGFNKFVPAAAIGGGGSNRQAGGLKAVIKISGGTVYAQSMGGPGIGGGGSALAGGGPANIEITGGTVIAKSTGGTYNGGKVDPGVSIGGGTGDTAGGSVQLNISGADTIVRAGSVGGGLATQEGAKVGSAKVTVSGGNIIGQVIMAGGAADPCSFTMTGGVMHSTNVVDGVTIGNANVTGVTVTDPNPSEPLAFRRQNGGAVFINDPRGTATVSGGLIGNCTANKGGAIYMAGGTFTLSGNGALGTNHAKESGGSVYVEEGTVNIKGGAIRNSDAQLSGGGVYVGKGKVNMSGGEIRENTTQENGGGLYVKGDEAQEGGTVTFTGGAIRNNSAQLSGGGMYVDSGKVDIKGGEIRNNTAVKDGGGVFVAGNVHMTGGDVTHNSAEANGGGIGVSDGVVLMYGGSLDHNTAKESGGGLYVSTITKDALVDIFSGSVSDNKAKKGGGIAVFSNETNGIGVTVGVNCAHPGLDEESQDRTFTPFAYPDRYPDVLTPENCGSAHAGHEHYHIQECTHSSCPVLSRNSAWEDGGGF